MADKLSNTLSDHIATINSNMGTVGNTNRVFRPNDISSDLNKAVAPGMYCYNGTEASTMSNKPFNSGAIVLVFSTGDNWGIVQIAITRLQAPSQACFRLCLDYGTTNVYWTAWKTLTIS